MRKLLIVLFLIIFAVAIPLAAQTPHAATGQVCSSAAKSSHKRSKTQIISVGVVNGKAIRLVKPMYPAAARAVNAHGSVQVQILIDERGCVESATAISGHPLLRPNSVKAAFRSMFEPVELSGNPIAVYGVIIYNYIPNRMNWLELGYFSDAESDLRDFLPSDFDAERELIRERQLSPPGRQSELMQEILKRIETRLIAEPKNLWLFNVGRELKLFKTECWSSDSCVIPKQRLGTLINTAPAGVSPILRKRLQEMLNEADHSILIRKQSDLVERLFDFGN